MKSLLWILIAALALTALGCAPADEKGEDGGKKDPAATDIADPDK